MRLKPNSTAELSRIVDSEVFPILRKQKGFREETTFIASDRLEAIANSFWDSREDEEAYSRTGYLEVLTALTNVIEGTPTVKTFDFVNSTFQKAVAGKIV